MNRMWDSIILPIIEYITPKHIVEVGSDTGINTKNILEYCAKNNAKLTAIDPLPGFNVDEFKKKYGEKFQFCKDLSLNVLPNIDDYDFIILDGDHNWYTVYNELKTIEKKFKGKNFPIIILHDVYWPYARRDLYYNPETIPYEYINPYKKLGIRQDEEELCEECGFNKETNNATQENTPKNGVLTAVEDFIHETDLNLSLFKIKAFFGLGILYINNEKIDNLIKSILLKGDIIKDLEDARMEIRIGHSTLLETIERLETTLSQQRQRIGELETILSQQLQRVDDLEASMSVKTERLIGLEKIVHQRQEKIQKLNKKEEENKIKIKTQRKEIEKMKSSKSWKITSPLRKIRKF